MKQWNKKGMMFILLISFYFFICLIVLQAQTAQDLNKEGYASYEKKDYCAAIDYFFKAIATDPLYVYSHYNLACVLSLLLAGNKTAAGLDEEQMLDSALAELRTCIALDASFKETIKTDSDLEFVRKTPQFLLLEDTVFNLQDFKDLLVKGRCYFPGLTKDRGYLYFFENSQCGYEDGAKTKLYKGFYYTFQEKERQVAHLFIVYQSGVWKELNAYLDHNEGYTYLNVSKSFEDENNWDRCFLSEGDRYFIAEERGRVFREINRTLPAEDASELNRQGYALYEQGRCKEAIPFFQDAIAKDPRFIVARYNLLCSAGIILGRRSGSQWDEEQKHFDIMGWEQIEAIRQMDIGFLIERKDDPDLAYFRHSMRFYRIIGWYDEPFIKIGKILGTVRYWSLPGLYGPLEIYDFAIDGGFEYTGHLKDTGIKKEMHNGSYELYRENGQLYILLTDPWSETGGKIKGLFRQDGIIETPRGNLIPNYENRGGA